MAGFMKFCKSRSARLSILFLLILCACGSKESSYFPFQHDLHLSYHPGNTGRIMVCFHGMGGDYRLAEGIKQWSKTGDTFVGFNFPDHGEKIWSVDPNETVFGSIEEILPALYVLKKVIVDQGFRQVVLYGFSAGGGALVNSLSVLNSTAYDEQLASVGIRKKDKEKMLNVIQKGWVILDAPLKSIGELTAHYGENKELQVLGARYRNNGMEPIENVQKLGNLSLKVIVHFQIPDEVLSNRDDELFVKLFKENNPKSFIATSVGEGGHSLPHESLWEQFNAIRLGF